MGRVKGVALVGGVDRSMMEKPSLEVVLQTLDALYRTENAGDKEKASLWLMKLHSSVRVSDFLLKHTTKVVCFDRCMHGK